MKAVNRRVFGAGLAICLLSASAWAQDGLRSASLPERNLNPSAPVDQFRVGPRFYSPVVDPRFPRDHRRPRFPRRFGLSPFGSYVSPWAPDDPAAAIERAGERLSQFQVAPATAEVRVDGFYVGNVDDVRRMGGRALEPGPHRIELRAAGFETVTFDVLIAEGETVLHRTDLEATARPATRLPRAGRSQDLLRDSGLLRGRPAAAGRCGFRLRATPRRPGLFRRRSASRSPDSRPVSVRRPEGADGGYAPRPGRRRSRKARCGSS